MKEKVQRKDVLDNNPVEIVQLRPDDWEMLRDLKLYSLEEEPVAFENPILAIKRYQDRPEQEWRTILSGGMSGGRTGETIMFFAKEDEKLVGMVSSIIPETEPNQPIIATIQHMYVSRDHRGMGIGRKLITSLLDNLRMRDHISGARLDVVVTQTPAISLYQSVGLRITGTSEGSIGWTEEPLDEYGLEITF